MPSAAISGPFDQTSEDKRVRTTLTTPYHFAGLELSTAASCGHQSSPEPRTRHVYRHRDLHEASWARGTRMTLPGGKLSQLRSDRRTELPPLTRWPRSPTAVHEIQPFLPSGGPAVREIEPRDGCWATRVKDQSSLDLAIDLIAGPVHGPPQLVVAVLLALLEL
jgi:hypothetical protein